VLDVDGDPDVVALSGDYADLLTIFRVLEGETDDMFGVDVSCQFGNVMALAQTGVIPDEYCLVMEEQVLLVTDVAIVELGSAVSSQIGNASRKKR